MRRGPPWLRIALRELSGGLAGFWIYLACLALGAWAIASAGSITSALNAGLDRQSRELLGGDAAITLSQRAASTEQRAWMEARGVVAEAAQADLMARAPGKISQADVRAIDGNFPLVSPTSSPAPATSGASPPVTRSPAILASPSVTGSASARFRSNSAPS